MPGLVFTKFVGKVLTHHKVVTHRIRDDIKPGSLLKVRITIPIGTATCEKVTRKKLEEVTDREAIADGFKSAAHYREEFVKIHRKGRRGDGGKKLKELAEDGVTIIEFKPAWPRLRLINIDNLDPVLLDTLNKIHGDQPGRPIWVTSYDEK